MVAGPADSIPEIPRAYYEGCALLVEKGELDPSDDMPPCEPCAEEDGERRPLTDVEEAEFAAELERVFLGSRIRLEGTK